MSTVFSFQAQLVSIMDALSNTAVAEISKLVEIESKMLTLEITRGRNEIVSLTEKLQLMENLLWIARGHKQDATAHGRTKTPTRVTDGSINNCFGRSQSEEGRPEIKSESSWESSCPPQETSVHRDEDTSLVEPTNVIRGQPELILIKEEPSEVDICNSGPERELISQKRAVALEVDAEKGCFDVRQHCVDDTIKLPSLTKSQVNQSSQSSSTDGRERQDTEWTQLTRSESQDAHLSPALPNSETGNSCSREIVSQSFSVTKNMRIHSLRTSPGAKRFGCIHCGKSFRCFSQLEIHQRSHTGEKPFRCTLCGKRYAQKGHLYTHQRTHTGEKPYRCLYCGKGFIQKCTLDMHERTHTGEKPFICGKCGKGFAKNCNLKKHMALHSDLSMHFYSESRVPACEITDGNGHGQIDLINSTASTNSSLCS